MDLRVLVLAVLAFTAACYATDPCDADPCLNGATCDDITGVYKCTCAPNYFGNECEEADNSSATCTCVNDWFGDHCTQREVEGVRLVCVSPDNMAINLDFSGGSLDADINIKLNTTLKAALAFTEMASDDCKLAGMGDMLFIEEGSAHEFDFEVDRTVLTSGLYKADEDYVISKKGMTKFRSLAELSGRGVVLCPLMQVSGKGLTDRKYRCAPLDPEDADEVVEVCCSLKYENLEEVLDS